LEGGYRTCGSVLCGDEGISEQRGLWDDSQIRRSSASIPANIAEGHGRENTGSFIQFLRIAQGSLKELETHLILAGRVGFMTEADMAPLLSQADEIGRMLRSMVRSLQQRK